MAKAGFLHKRLRPVNRGGPMIRGTSWEGAGMTGLALIMFIGLFAFGGQLLGWTDYDGHVQLGLFAAFLFGIICGYRTRG
jgi:hypothetical protein